MSTAFHFLLLHRLDIPVNVSKYAVGVKHGILASSTLVIGFIPQSELLYQSNSSVISTEIYTTRLTHFSASTHGGTTHYHGTTDLLSEVLASDVFC